jgi:hypothetical protein
MKPYIYLSDAKVEHHFEQIPQSFFSTSKINKLLLKLGIADVEFSDTTKPLNRYSKLAAVLAELTEQESIGTLDQPRLYFRGRLNMKYGIYPNTEIVYFTGRIDDTIVALVGSLRHVEGSQVLQTLTRSPWGSSSIGVTKSLVEELNLKPIIDKYTSSSILNTEAGCAEEPDVYPLDMMVGEAHRLIQGPLADVEFIALRLNEGYFEDRKTLLGTPFYVAYAT